MIVSFGDRGTADLFHGRPSRKARHFPSDIVQVALRKLDMLNAARVLSDLRSPPESGYYSIRINNQWRVVFTWEDSQAHDVQIVDYHRG